MDPMEISEDDQSQESAKTILHSYSLISMIHTSPGLHTAACGLSNSGDIQTATPGNILWFLDGGARSHGGQLRHQATAARKRSKNWRKPYSA